MDALGIALVKSLEERLLSRFVGNGNVKSGIVKGIIGVLIPSLIGSGGKYKSIIAQAFIIDSAEDLVNAGMNYFAGGIGGDAGGVI